MHPIVFSYTNMKRTTEALSLKHSPATPPEAVFKTVCVDLAEDITADLVSIWFFDDDQSAIHCQLYYDVRDHSFTKGQVLYRKDCPHYFQAIIEDSCIAAFDAQHQNATRELAEVYLIPNGIQSSLDFILHKGRTPVGVICCESREIARDWTEADKNKLRVIAELVSHRFNFNLANTA